MIVPTARTARETVSTTTVAREVHAGTTASVVREEPSIGTVFGESLYPWQSTSRMSLNRPAGCQLPTGMQQQGRQMSRR